MARIVVPLYPHHVTQRGNRRQPTFFGTADYREYLRLIERAKRRSGVTILAYCLMPNHVHFAVVPQHRGSLHQFFAEAHRRYSYRINRREGWHGHLWQSRFYSNAMDEAHLISTVRYIELNPVAAGLCLRPEEWPWSSVHAHLLQVDDRLVSVAPMLERVSDWREYLAAPELESNLVSIRKHARTGRPLGSEDFLQEIELITGRSLRNKKPGRRSDNPSGTALDSHESAGLSTNK
jgi:putative transposase